MAFGAVPLGAADSMNGRRCLYLGDFRAPTGVVCPGLPTSPADSKVHEHSHGQLQARIG
jgi:hypothetical protein